MSRRGSGPSDLHATAPKSVRQHHKAYWVGTMGDFPAEGRNESKLGPPLCAARRRTTVARTNCRGAQTNAALNARVRPNRQRGSSRSGSCFVAPTKLPNYNSDLRHH